MRDAAPLLIVSLLGAAHGLNPAMGWLFALSLGLQEQRRGAVWRAFGPLALGHALAVGLAIAAAGLMGLILPLGLLKWLVAGALVGMGLLQLFRHRHLARGGMRVRPRDLVAWSFLMATAHGAGLMVVPFLLPAGENAVAHASEAHVHMWPGGAGATAPSDAEATALLGMLLHTGTYLAVAALLAVLVYETQGLRLLRTAWFNVNLLWAGALILTGVLTPLL